MHHTHSDSSIWDFSIFSGDSRVFPDFLAKETVHHFIELEKSRRLLKTVIDHYLQAISAYWKYILDYHDISHIFSKHFLFKNFNYRRKYIDNKKQNIFSSGLWRVLYLPLMKLNNAQFHHNILCSLNGTQLQFSVSVSPFSSKMISISEHCEFLLESHQAKTQFMNRVRNELFFPLLQLYLPKRCIAERGITKPSSIVACPQHIQQMLDVSGSRYNDVVLGIREKIIEHAVAHRCILPLKQLICFSTSRTLTRYKKKLQKQNDAEDFGINEHTIDDFISILAHTMDILILPKNENGQECEECVVYAHLGSKTFIYTRIPFEISSFVTDSQAQDLDDQAFINHLHISYERFHNRSYEQLWDSFVSWMKQLNKNSNHLDSVEE